MATNRQTYANWSNRGGQSAASQSLTAMATAVSNAFTAAAATSSSHAATTVATSAAATSSTATPSAVPTAQTENRTHVTKHCNLLLEKMRKKYAFTPDTTNVTYSTKASIASIHGHQAMLALECETARNQLTYKDNERMGPIKFFRGYIADTKDRHKPTKYTSVKGFAMLHLTEYYDGYQGTLADRLYLKPADKGKLFVKGYVPCVLSEVIYEVRLQQQYRMKEKVWLWSIITVNVVPQLSQLKMRSIVRRYAKEDATMRDEIAETPVIDGVLSAVQTAVVDKCITKEIKAFENEQWDMNAAHGENSEKERFFALLERLTYGGAQLKTLFTQTRTTHICFISSNQRCVQGGQFV